MRDVGNFTGAFAGGMVALAQATGQAVRASAQHQRNLRTVAEWSRALDAQRQARIAAEREGLRLLQEVQFLRQALFEAEEELEILRNL